MPPLDRKCAECQGAGAVTCGDCRGAGCLRCGYGYEVTCGVCNRAQRVPTEEGEELLTFLRRHYLNDEAVARWPGGS